MRLGVLVSGRGSNLGAVLDAAACGLLPGVEPVLVISNRSGVPAIEVAAAHRVPVRLLRRSDFADAEARDAEIGNALTDAGADLALLAGYDQLLHRPYFDAFTGRTINIHPSLLPRHGGPGMMGRAVHAAVMAAGDRETGVTVHWVTPELDAGPTIAQVRTTVEPGETVDALAARVLVIEHDLIVQVLGDLAADMGAGWSSGSMTAASRAPERLAAAQQRSHFDA